MNCKECGKELSENLVNNGIPHCSPECSKIALDKEIRSGLG